MFAVTHLAGRSAVSQLKNLIEGTCWIVFDCFDDSTNLQVPIWIVRIRDVQGNARLTLKEAVVAAALRVGELDHAPGFVPQEPHGVDQGCSVGPDGGEMREERAQEQVGVTLWNIHRRCPI